MGTRGTLASVALLVVAAAAALWMQSRLAAPPSPGHVAASVPLPPAPQSPAVTPAEPALIAPRVAVPLPPPPLPSFELPGTNAPTTDLRSLVWHVQPRPGAPTLEQIAAYAPGRRAAGGTGAAAGGVLHRSVSR